MNGRLTILCLTTVILGASTLAACDTGDGKTLKDYDADDYPSQTVPPTTIEGEGFDSLEALDDPPVGDAAETSNEPFQVFAPWVAGGEIDVRSTCAGDNIAPAVSWGAVPDGTVEIALALVDDSVVSDGQPFVHWVIAGLDPAEIALVEGDVPPGAVQALNFFGDVGYGGPCPPPGDDAHLYRLTASALNNPLEVADGTPASEFLDAIARVAIGSADLSGTFQR